MASRLRRSQWVRITICLVIIAVLTYLYLWRLWAASPADRVYLPDATDLGRTFFPPRQFFANMLADGRFAVWNPHVYAGYPQFADPQAATFYPIALLLAWLTGASFSLGTIAFNIALHFFLIGAFSFFFFRHLFKANLPALLSALLFEFGGYLSFYPVQQLSELEVAAWLPLTLLFLLLAVERRSWFWVALAGTSMGMAFLARRPQSYLTIGPLTLAWFAYNARRDEQGWGRIVGKLTLFTTFALGVATAQWLPTLELTRLSTRSELTYKLVSEGGFPFNEIAGFFAPQLVGTQNLYVGLTALLLTGLALQQRKGLFWSGLFLIFLFGSVGKFLALFDALYLVQRLGFPGYLRNVERLAFGMTFALAALSGYGIQQLRHIDRELLRRVALIGGSLFGVTLLLTTLGREPTEQLTQIDLLVRTAMMIGGVWLALWVWRDRPKIAIIVTIAIAVIDPLSLNQGRFTVSDPAASFPPGNDIERIAAAPLLESQFYRTVFPQTPFRDYGSQLQVDALGGTPPLELLDYNLLRETLPDDYRRNILLNVEMVITTGVYDNPAFELLKEEGVFRYYRFNVAKPRAYLVNGIVEVTTSTEAADTLAVASFDYGNKAIVTGQTGLTTDAPLAPTEWARLVERTPNRLVVETSAEQPRYLVIAETYYPGWRATIDGVATDVYPTNIALRGVVVPAGEHTIVLEFRPNTLLIGVSLSLLTILIVSFWAILSLRRKNHATTHAN